MVPQLARFTDLGLLLLRLMVGIVFISSGLRLKLIRADSIPCPRCQDFCETIRPGELMSSFRIALLAICRYYRSQLTPRFLDRSAGSFTTQHRPVQGAQVTLPSTTSDWSKSSTSDNSGEFRFDNVPLGDYRVTVELAGLAT